MLIGPFSKDLLLADVGEVHSEVPEKNGRGLGGLRGPEGM